MTLDRAMFGVMVFCSVLVLGGLWAWLVSRFHGDDLLPPPDEHGRPR